MGTGLCNEVKMLMDRSEGIEEKLTAMADENFRLPEAPEAFREALFNETVAKVRARPRKRHMLTLAALVLAWGGGMASMNAISGDTRDAAQQPKTAGTISLAPLPEPALQTAAFDAEAMARRIAEAPAAEKIRLLQKTGDYYFARYDYRRATRCYARMLDLTSETEHAPEDNWLLTRLKEARDEERHHAIPEA
jgi:hypothetical protein